MKEKLLSKGDKFYKSSCLVFCGWDYNLNQVKAGTYKHVSLEHEIMVSIYGLPPVLLFLCPARYDRRDIMFPGCPTFLPSVLSSIRHTLGVPLCVQRPAKAMLFQQIIMHALQSQHNLDVHLLFCFDHDLNITSSQGHV